MLQNSPEAQMHHFKGNSKHMRDKLSNSIEEKRETGFRLNK